MFVTNKKDIVRYLIKKNNTLAIRINITNKHFKIYRLRQNQNLIRYNSRTNYYCSNITNFVRSSTRALISDYNFNHGTFAD